MQNVLHPFQDLAQLQLLPGKLFLRHHQRLINTYRISILLNLPHVVVLPPLQERSVVILFDGVFS